MRLKNQQIRSLIKDAFNTSDPDFIKRTNRYYLMLESKQESQNGICSTSSCNLPLTSIHFTGVLGLDNLLDIAKWQGTCRFHHLDPLGFKNNKISSSSSTFSSPAASSIAVKPKGSKEAAGEDFYHYHKRRINE